jgi:thiol-disulfide isomerase/thioredoxin
MFACSYRTRLMLCLLCVPLLALIACSKEELNPESLIGAPVPELEGADLTGTGITELADLVGKPTAVVFWLNTCPHCQESLPAIQDAWADFASESNILTVGMNNVGMEGSAGFETPEAFISSTGLTLPSIEYTWEQAQSRWSVPGVPTIFILNSEHVVEDVLLGSDDLVRRLESALDEVR